MKDGTVEFTVKKIADTNSIDSLNQKLATKQDILEDTGWVTITDIHDGYTVRNPYTPKIRRIGQVVYLEIQLEQSAKGATEMFNLPAGFAPGREITLEPTKDCWLSYDGQGRTNYKGGDGSRSEYIQINCSWAVD